MAVPGIAAELLGLADRIGQIRAVGRNGDATPFYEDRSQAMRDARALAQFARTGTLPADFVPASERSRDDERRTSYRERR